MLVVPGGPGWGADYMIESITSLLGNGHRLYFIDQRATGRSPRGTGPLTVEAYAEDMAAIADHFGLKRFDLLGHSFGGLQCATFALSNPHRVNSLVIVEGDSPTRRLWERVNDPDAPMQERTTPDDQAVVEEIIADPEWTRDQDKVDRYLIAAYRAMYVDPTLADGVKHGLDGEGVLQLHSTSRAVRDALADWDITDALADIRIPTLLVYGRESIFGPETAQAMQTAIPGSQLVLVAGGHSPFLEDPAGFSRAVNDFFSGRSG